MNIELPADYVRYVESGGLLEGFTAGEPGYFQLWPLAEVRQLNKQYEVEKYVSGFLCFGSDGGGELLAFDLNGAVFKIPAIGMEPATVMRIGETWREVESRIERAT